MPGWVGRDATPANGTGEAEGIEPARIVVRDAGGEEGSLPLDGRGLEAFKLLEGGEDTFFSTELTLRREVLPMEEPAEIDCRRDGFDLFAEGAEGEAVDVLEDASLTPLDVMIVRWG